MKQHHLRSILDLAARLREDSSFRGPVAACASLTDGLLKMKESRSPSDTPGAHVKKLNEARSKADKKAIELHNRIQDIKSESEKALSQRIGAKLNMTPDAPYMNLVLTRFVSMSKADQHELVNDLVNTNNGPILSIIISAPSFLTGFTQKEKDDYMKANTLKNAPEEFAEQQALAKDHEVAITIAGVVLEALKSYVDDDAAKAVANGEREAEAALAAFTQSAKTFT